MFDWPRLARLIRRRNLCGLVFHSAGRVRDLPGGPLGGSPGGQTGSLGRALIWRHSELG